jgi:hypothetical protein
MLCVAIRKTLNTLYGQNAKLLNIKAGSSSTYSYHCALKSYIRLRCIALAVIPPLLIAEPNV